MSSWAQLSLLDATSPVMEEFVYFHDFAMVVLTLIITAVGLVLSGALLSPFIHRGLLEGQTVECIWTIVPAIILIQIAIPSLLLLYMLDDSTSDSVTIKTIGHQWYWSYEYSDFWQSEGTPLEFDSYLDPEAATRLLDSDSRVVLPSAAHVRMIVGAADVLHSWTIPSLGVKVDGCPGRLNQVKFMAHRPGVLYGQCSEICGANHSFMPISAEVVSTKDFCLWLEASLNS